MWEIEISGLPPSVNHCYVAHAIRGKRFKSREYLDWERRVEAVLCKAPEFPQVLGPLSVEILFYAPDWYTLSGSARKKDIGNLEKAAVDSLFKHLEIDDCWIFDERLRKMNGDDFKTVIRVWDLGHQ